MKHVFKKAVALFLAVLMVAGMLQGVSAAATGHFKDVDDGAWYAPYVKYAYEHDPQLMNGMSEDTFEPETELSRAMAAVVLYRLSGEKVTGSATFSDLDPNMDWYREGIVWAQQKKVINGTGDNRFEPDRAVTREELATMLWRYIGEPKPAGAVESFPDMGDVSDYAADAIGWAISVSMLQGDQGKLYPQRTATRAEFAKLLTVFVELSKPHEHQWSAGEVTKEPTCTEDGVRSFSCACGETKTETFPALGHLDEDPKDDRCDRCGEWLGAEKVTVTLVCPEKTEKVDLEPLATFTFPGCAWEDPLHEFVGWTTLDGKALTAEQLEAADYYFEDEELTVSENVTFYAFFEEYEASELPYYAEPEPDLADFSGEWAIVGFNYDAETDSYDLEKPQAINTSGAQVDVSTLSGVEIFPVDNYSEFRTEDKTVCLTLALGEDGHYTIKCADKKYLAWNGTDNGLTIATSTTDNNKAKWDIELDLFYGGAYVRNVEDPNRILLYHDEEGKFEVFDDTQDYAEGYKPSEYFYLWLLQKGFRSFSGYTAQPTATPSFEFTVLSTSDMHGKAWDENILNDEAVKTSMLQVSTAVKSVRAENENVILVDNGDLYEGTPVSTLNIQKLTNHETERPNPMALALKYIGYDYSVLGNHEFNFPWATMNSIYDYLESDQDGEPVKVMAGNLYYTDTTEEHTAGERPFRAWDFIDIPAGDDTFRIAIIGLENTDCARYDVPDNYPGIVFMHPDNPTASLLFEIERCQKEIEEAGGADFVLVSMHTGYASKDTTAPQYGVNSSNQANYVIANSTGVDMFILGHDHTPRYGYTTYKNADGRYVAVVNAGQTRVTKTTFSVMQNANGEWAVRVLPDVSKSLILSDFEPDEELRALMQPYVTEATDYVSQKLGTITGEWDEGFSNTTTYYLKRHDNIDFINRSQIWASSKYLLEKYSTEEARQELYAKYPGLDHLTVDISASAMVFNGASTLKPGDVSMRDIYKIYRYENSIYVIPVKGSEIRTMLESVATNHITVSLDEAGNATFGSKESNTNPIFYGLEFRYNMALPAGERVVDLKLKGGAEIDENKYYLVAVNNYHLGNNKSPFGKYKTTDAIWSQTDDATGFVQDMMADFLAYETQQHGGVQRDPSKWEIVYEPAGEP